ncbi:MAG: VOC family protein [Gammaproteobacteria bacterium]|nr:VOC family protein [Gammaproteobacteria bacterium]
MEHYATTKHGAFSWNELMTTDVSAAKAFYAELFGWDMHDEQAPGMTYTVLITGGQKVGGIMAMPEDVQDAPPAWGAYVTVDDVDKQTQRASQLGATVILPPCDIPRVGRFAVIRDPQGAILSLITYLQA